MMKFLVRSYTLQFSYLSWHCTEKQCSDHWHYSALSPVLSTNVVCVKTQQKHARIKHHDRTNNSIISLKI